MPPTPQQRRLVAGLRTLKKLQETGAKAFRAAAFSRRAHDALVDSGYLKLVVKGWYIASRPGDAAGDTTPWQASIRSFLGSYLEQRFGSDWHMSPEVSVLLHAGATSLPSQVVAHSPRGNNNFLALPGGCALIDVKSPEHPQAEQLQTLDGVRVLSLPAALVRVSDPFFTTYPVDAQVALTQLRDAADLNRELLRGNHSRVAGRLVGALRAAHRHELADDVRDTMRAVGNSVQETNPFRAPLPELRMSREPSPYVLRLRLMWNALREQVSTDMPPAPTVHPDPASQLAAVQDAFAADAYHSLSIEGYQVTAELIERVATGAWNPETHKDDATNQNAMAARGYWQAHRMVTQSLTRILADENAGTVTARDHGKWYRELFGPSVNAGLLTDSDLAGYRNGPVYIKNARHVPPSYDAARDMMPVLFELLTEEPSAAVRAVLGHYCFVFIHPYMDGNGRMARFLMNTMLISGGYPWTIIPVERRAEYLGALDTASGDGNIQPFARFIASCLARSSR